MIDCISDKLQIYCLNECEITKYADGASLLSDYYQNYFDALFLYVDMPGLNGMKISEKIRENDTFYYIGVDYHSPSSLWNQKAVWQRGSNYPIGSFR